MQKKIYLFLLFSFGCQDKDGFNVPGGGNNSANEPSNESNNQRDCPEAWEQQGEVWLTPSCAAWSPMVSGFTWHEAINLSQATTGGCNATCDEEPDFNYCADLNLDGYSWRLPTITELENLAMDYPPFTDVEGDLWSISSDSMDQLAWTANVDQPGMSVLLDKSASANVRCIAK